MKSLKETIEKAAWGRLNTQETRDLVERELEKFFSVPKVTVCDPTREDFIERKMRINLNFGTVVYGPDGIDIVKEDL